LTAVVTLRRGDLECADAEFKNAIHLEPKFAWAHYNLGLVYRQKKRREDAVREFREALNSNPRFDPARQALASMGMKQP
jgi:Tfp pilus assembly protein PilF